MNATLVALGLVWATWISGWSVFEALYGDQLVHRPWYARWHLEHFFISTFFVVGTAAPILFAQRSRGLLPRERQWRAELGAALAALLASSMLSLTVITRFGGVALFVGSGSRCYGVALVAPYLYWDPLWVLYLTLPAAGAALVGAMGLRAAARSTQIR